MNLFLLVSLSSEKFDFDILTSTQILEACAVPGWHRSEEPGLFGSAMESLTGSHVSVFTSVLPNEFENS